MNPPPGYRLGYDAVEDKKRRRPPQVRLLSEDNQLKPSQRKKLVATTRDIRRNCPVAAWGIRKHLDYVSTFSFQARTEDPEFNQRLEDLVRWWSRPRNFEVAGRHSRPRFIRLGEAMRTIDGDFFTLKLRSGHVQGIEGDRIRTPWGGLPEGIDPAEIIHGVRVSKAGRARGYCLCNRNQYGDGFRFARMLPARHVVPHGYYDRIDQVRGVSPLAAALNTLIDRRENFDYALAKNKVIQLFGLVFKRDSEEAVGDVSASLDEEGQADKSETSIDFGRGPFQVDLERDETAEFLESQHPSSGFKELNQAAIMIALKALDIPYSFFAEDFTNYSGSRQALLLYEQSAQGKQQDNRELLDALTAWRIGLWILDDTLELPAGWTIDQLKWEWIAKGIPWIQPLQEMKADGEGIDRGLISRTRVLKRQGLDFYDIADELAAEKEYLEERHLPSGPPAKAPAPIGATDAIRE